MLSIHIFEYQRWLISWIIIYYFHEENPRIKSDLQCWNKKPWNSVIEKIIITSFVIIGESQKTFAKRNDNKHFGSQSCKIIRTCGKSTLRECLHCSIEDTSCQWTLTMINYSNFYLMSVKFSLNKPSFIIGWTRTQRFIWADQDIG